jgi:hypothetical protein
MQKLGYSFGLLLASLLLFGSGAIVGWSSKIAIQGLNATVVVQTSAVLVTIFVAIWTYRKTKQKEAEARLFSQKASVYEPLVEQLKRLQGSTKPGLTEPFNEDEFAKALFDIQFRAIIWGDEQMIKILSDLSEEVTDGDNQTSFGRMASLYEQIRKELGHRDKRGVGWDIIALNLVAKDRHIAQEMKKASLLKY